MPPVIQDHWEWITTTLLGSGASLLFRGQLRRAGAGFLELAARRWDVEGELFRANQTIRGQKLLIDQLYGALEQSTHANQLVKTATEASPALKSAVLNPQPSANSSGVPVS